MLVDCSYAEREGFEIGQPFEDTLESMSNLDEQRRMVHKYIVMAYYAGCYLNSAITTLDRWMFNSYHLSSFFQGVGQKPNTVKPV